MKVKCVICGKEEEINKLHKDYKKLNANPNAAYICELCSIKVNDHAAKKNAILEHK